MTMDPGKLNTISWASFKVEEDFSSEMLELGYVKALYEAMIPISHAEYVRAEEAIHKSAISRRD